MNTSKKWLLLISLLLLMSASSCSLKTQGIGQTSPAIERQESNFTFVVLGDNRSGDDIYKKLVVMAMERKPFFVVNTGDMIATPGNKSDWAKFWEMSKLITVPYYLTVGNHDANPRVPFSEQVYKQEVDLPGNELYYSFAAGNSLFIVLDSFIDGQEKRIMGEQFKWLEDLLARSDQLHKFVFIHHPLFTEPGKGVHSGTSLDLYPKERDRLEALFVKAKVTAVFCGHEHFYQRKTVDGITHIITGGGGAPLYGKDEDGAFNHFIVVTVDNDKVSSEVIDLQGKVRDQF